MFTPKKQHSHQREKHLLDAAGRRECIVQALNLHGNAGSVPDASATFFYSQRLADIAAKKSERALANQLITANDLRGFQKSLAEARLRFNARRFPFG